MTEQKRKAPQFHVSGVEVTMKKLCLLFLVMLIVPSMAVAKNYDVTVTRNDSGRYIIDGKNMYIHTRYCYEYAYSESAFLKMRGYSGEIIFINSNNKCDVKAVYGPIEQGAGKYAVTINMEDYDWYEIWGQDIYIKTSGCASLALSKEVVLSINAGGYGTLYIGDNQCMVEGLYSKMRL